MSRAEYLSKYVSSDKPKRHKKKRNEEFESSVVVMDQNIVALPDTNENNDEDRPVDHLSNSAPVAPKKNFKGFRRIDTNDSVSDPPDRTGVNNVSDQETSAPQEANISQKVDDTQEPRLGHETNVSQETIYRDKSGRVIDIKAKREQLQHQRTKESQQKEQAAALNQGDAQKAAELELRSRISNATTFLVSSKDEQFVSHMKSREIFDDPVATFAPSAKPLVVSSVGRPTYHGVSSSNRYNIKAGVFWDGIDRSNGFESLVLQKRNQAIYEKKLKHDYYNDIDDIDLDF